MVKGAAMKFKVLMMALLAAVAAAAAKVIDISKEHPRYFVEGATGKTWIPIGVNLCFDRWSQNDADTRAKYERWLRDFAANGGNSIRLWCGHTSLEVMPRTPGEWDAEKTRTIQHIMRLCEELGIKVKFTLESFRYIRPAKPDVRPVVQDANVFRIGDLFNRPLFIPYAKNVPEFFKSPRCREIYLQKAEYLGKTLGFADSSALYCWELWNEINCCGTIRQWDEWARWAMPELKRRFPKQLVVNNLGSFSETTSFRKYDVLAAERDNDFMEIHRYLDGRSNHEACKGPMDLIAASAVRELLPRTSGPVVVAEIGAVEPGHAGPSRLYAKDKDGTLLHDALFASFFCGAAGCGQFWHWDGYYIARNQLWWQFRRFAEAIAGVDPVAERFQPFYTESRQLRFYGLRGKKTTLIWCRDKRCDWRSELADGKAPETISSVRLPIHGCTFECYNPWTDKHTRIAAPKLPPFKRSLVIKLPTSAIDAIIDHW